MSLKSTLKRVKEIAENAKPSDLNQVSVSNAEETILQQGLGQSKFELKEEIKENSEKLESTQENSEKLESTQENLEKLDPTQENLEKLDPTQENLEKYELKLEQDEQAIAKAKAILVKEFTTNIKIVQSLVDHQDVLKGAEDITDAKELMQAVQNNKAWLIDVLIIGTALGHHKNLRDYLDALKAKISDGTDAVTRAIDTIGKDLTALLSADDERSINGKVDSLYNLKNDIIIDDVKNLRFNSCAEAGVEKLADNYASLKNAVALRQGKDITAVLRENGEVGKNALLEVLLRPSRLDPECQKIFAALLKIETASEETLKSLNNVAIQYFVEKQLFTQDNESFSFSEDNLKTLYRLYETVNIVEKELEYTFAQKANDLGADGETKEILQSLSIDKLISLKGYLNTYITDLRDQFARENDNVLAKATNFANSLLSNEYISQVKKVVEEVINSVNSIKAMPGHENDFTGVAENPSLNNIKGLNLDDIFVVGALNNAKKTIADYADQLKQDDSSSNIVNDLVANLDMDKANDKLGVYYSAKGIFDQCSLKATIASLVTDNQQVQFSNLLQNYDDSMYLGNCRADITTNLPLVCNNQEDISMQYLAGEVGCSLVAFDL